MSERVLIIDDDRGIHRAFIALLAENGLEACAVSGGAEALALLSRQTFALALLDVEMPGMGGMSVLKELRRLYPELVVVMVSGHAQVALAVEAVKLGAYDYLTKPPDPDQLMLTIERALEKKRLNRELSQLDRSLDASLARQLGHSKAIRQVIEDLRRVAATDFSLIIEGETGTGKTMIASLIHGLSPRSAGPFISIDLANIPETLLESELFGHEKGAFTGAERRKKGFFELAQGGTLLLDELQNLSLQTQARLLKVVEEKTFYPLGGSSPHRVDLRLIGASNRDLAKAVAEKTFRQDLYYRLHEYRITLPPLRMRQEDIPHLASRFLEEAAGELKRAFSGLEEDSLSLLMAQPWPGNVRELKNLIRRAAIQSDAGNLVPELFVRLLSGGQSSSPGADGKTPLSLEQAEKAAISQALAHTDGNRTRAAAILGITHKTLLAKISKYQL